MHLAFRGYHWVNYWHVIIIRKSLFTWLPVPQWRFCLLPNRQRFGSPVKILPLAYPAKINFEECLAKFEASTSTKFTKDDCRTITVTNKRLGIGQAPFIEKLMCPHFAIIWLGLLATEWRFMSLRTHCIPSCWVSSGRYPFLRDPAAG